MLQNTLDRYRQLSTTEQQFCQACVLPLKFQENLVPFSGLKC